MKRIFNDTLNDDDDEEEDDEEEDDDEVPEPQMDLPSTMIFNPKIKIDERSENKDGTEEEISPDNQ